MIPSFPSPTPQQIITAQQSSIFSPVQQGQPTPAFPSPPIVQPTPGFPSPTQQLTPGFPPPPIVQPTPGFPPPPIVQPTSGFPSPTQQPTPGFPPPPIVQPTPGFPSPTQQPTSGFPSPTQQPTSGFPPPIVESTSGFPPPIVESTSGFPPPIVESTSGFPPPIVQPQLTISPPTSFQSSISFSFEQPQQFETSIKPKIVSPIEKERESQLPTEITDVLASNPFLKQEQSFREQELIPEITREEFEPEKITTPSLKYRSEYEKIMSQHTPQQLTFLKRARTALEKEEIFYRDIPIACYTCGRRIGRFQERYNNLLMIGKTPNEAMNVLGIFDSHCRMNVLSPSVIPIGAPLRILKREFEADPEADPESKLNNIRSMSLAEYRSLIFRQRKQADENLEPLRTINLSGFNSNYKIEGAEAEDLEDLSHIAGGEFTSDIIEEEVAGLEGFTLSVSNFIIENPIDPETVDGGLPLKLSY